MDGKRVITADEKLKIVKLKVKVGTMIYDGRVLLIYEPVSDDPSSNEGKQSCKKLMKSSEAGIIRKILIKEGAIISPGTGIIELEKECNHPTVIKDLCAECGADLQKENEKEGFSVSQASVSMVHMVPELKVNDELAQILGKADMNRLLEQKKLVLLVDLDQTLIHTTNDEIPNNIKDVYHFQLYGSRSPWYHTRLRPGTHSFLQGVSEKYELHICTFGSRRYAHTIARFLDSDGKIFSHRILSRDECFDANSKTANLKALFPCGENMVCIIDDREDVWDYASNLIHVKPYHFFQHTGDIHAPPGLTKCENDDIKQGFDFTQLDNNSESTPNEKSIKDENNPVGVETESMDLNNENKESSEDDRETNGENIGNSLESIEGKENAETDEERTSNPNVIVEEKSSNETIKEENSSSEALITDKEFNSNDKNTPNNDENDSESNNDTHKDIEVNKVNDSNSINFSNTTGVEIKPKIESEHSVIHSPISSKPDADGLIVIEESDDYLLYLEEILKIIHAEFFKFYEQTGNIPDLKRVIPETRATVLRDVNIVFSGIVPNHMRLENSQAYKIARSLGANVTQNIEAETTHLVALRAGTAKVHAASKRKNIKLVTPEWLWTCAERWEKVDERLFPIKDCKLNTESRNPPAHCRSPDRIEPPLPIIAQTSKVTHSPQNSGFLLSINPLMSLSSEEIESMEGEVEDIFRESDDETETDKETPSSCLDQSQEDIDYTQIRKKRKLEEQDNSSNSSSSIGDEDDSGKCASRTRRKKQKMLSKDISSSFNLSNAADDNEDDDEEKEDSDDYEEKEDSDDETIADKFRRGEDLPSDLDIDYNTEEGTEEDQESDGEWNMMGAALEREFLDED